MKKIIAVTGICALTGCLPAGLLQPSITVIASLMKLKSPAVKEALSMGQRLIFQKLFFLKP